MEWTDLSAFVKDFWGVWLMLLFFAATGWALWPSRKRKEYMDRAARIPFEEDDTHNRAAGARTGG